MSKRTLLIWIIGGAAISVAAISLLEVVGQKQSRAMVESRRDYFKEQFPDSRTREIASTIHVKEVESIHIQGIHIGYFDPAPLVIRDVNVQRVLIEALQQATTGTNIAIGNGVNSLKIHFKKKDGRTRESEYFAFNPQHTNIWYGTKFSNALNILSSFQADQVRQRDKSTSVQQVKFVQFRKSKIVDQQRIQSLIDALKNVDRRAYAYTIETSGASANNFATVHFALRDGKTIDFRFVLSPKAPNSKVEPLWRLYERLPESR